MQVSNYCDLCVTILPVFRHETIPHLEKERLRPFVITRIARSLFTYVLTLLSWKMKEFSFCYFCMKTDHSSTATQ